MLFRLEFFGISTAIVGLTIYRIMDDLPPEEVCAADYDDAVPVETALIWAYNDLFGIVPENAYVSSTKPMASVPLRRVYHVEYALDEPTLEDLVLGTLH